MKFWTVNYDSGYMSIVKADTKENATKQAKRDAKEQDWYVRKVSEATEEDISWVKNMGGYVPN